MENQTVTAAEKDKRQVMLAIRHDFERLCKKYRAHYTVAEENTPDPSYLLFTIRIKA